jgi:hypothetical protein
LSAYSQLKAYEAASSQLIATIFSTSCNLTGKAKFYIVRLRFFVWQVPENRMESMVVLNTMLNTAELARDYSVTLWLVNWNKYAKKIHQKLSIQGTFKAGA